MTRKTPQGDVKIEYFLKEESQARLNEFTKV